MNQIVHSGLGQAAALVWASETPSAVSLPQGAETAPLTRAAEVADTESVSAANSLGKVLAAPAVDHGNTLFGGIKSMLQAAKSVVNKKLDAVKGFAHALPPISKVVWTLALVGATLTTGCSREAVSGWKDSAGRPVSNPVATAPAVAQQNVKPPVVPQKPLQIATPDEVQSALIVARELNQDVDIVLRNAGLQRPIQPAAAAPVAKPEVKPAAAPVAKPEVKPAAAPVAKPEVKPAAAPVAKPEVKPAAAPVAKPEVKPAAAPAAKSAEVIPKGLAVMQAAQTPKEFLAKTTEAQRLLYEAIFASFEWQRIQYVIPTVAANGVVLNVRVVLPDGEVKIFDYKGRSSDGGKLNAPVANTRMDEAAVCKSLGLQCGADTRIVTILPKKAGDKPTYAVKQKEGGLVHFAVVDGKYVRAAAQNKKQPQNTFDAKAVAAAATRTAEAAKAAARAEADAAVQASAIANARQVEYEKAVAFHKYNRQMAELGYMYTALKPQDFLHDIQGKTQYSHDTATGTISFNGKDIARIVDGSLYLMVAAKSPTHKMFMAVPFLADGRPSPTSDGSITADQTLEAVQIAKGRLQGLEKLLRDKPDDVQVPTWKAAKAALQQRITAFEKYDPAAIKCSNVVVDGTQMVCAPRSGGK